MGNMLLFDFGKMELLKKLLIALYVGLLLVMAAATFAEQVYGTGWVEEQVYHTGWFCGLWGALAVSTGIVFVKRALWRRLPLVLLHGSFLVILAGALITFITGEKGQMHLRPGVAVDSFRHADNSRSILCVYHAVG
jgi:hypothetical protein